MSVETLVTLLLSFVGFPALVSILVNVLKKFGVVQDGDAGKWVTGANVFGLLLLFIAKAFFPQLDLGQIDQYLSVVAQILALVLALIPANLISQATHSALRGLPLVGTSFSLMHRYFKKV